LTEHQARDAQPIVSNGLPLTKIHHAAFDANLIGVDPNFRVHASHRLLEIHDGPFLELGLKGIAGASLGPPQRRRIVLIATVSPSGSSSSAPVDLRVLAILNGRRSPSPPSSPD
jgi:hypothetical protein